MIAMIILITVFKAEMPMCLYINQICHMPHEQA